MEEREQKIALAVARDAARQAGAVLRQRFAGPLVVEHKGEHNLVTQVDRASEALLCEALREAFPDDAILAEESGAHRGVGGRRWILDPLDGTTNFVHGIPQFAVSIALEVDHVIEIGVVFDPIKEELFEAHRGGGARLNGRSLSVSKVARLHDAVVGTGFPTDRTLRMERCVPPFVEVMGRIRAIRRAGAAALDLAWVGAGRLDGFWELALSPWDVAAGLLIVWEAGGMISDLHGQPYSLGAPWILASNGIVHEELSGVLAAFDPVHLDFEPR